MLSNQIILNIFSQFFVGAVALIAAFGFFYKYQREHLQKDLLLFVFAAIFFVYVFLIEISQLAFAVSSPGTDFCIIQRVISVVLLFITLVLWEILIFKFRLAKIWWVNALSFVFGGAAIFVSMLIFTNRLHLPSPTDVTQPVTILTYPLPVKIAWVAVWFLFAAAYLWRYFKLGSGSRKTLAFLSFFSCAVLFSSTIASSMARYQGDWIYSLSFVVGGIGAMGFLLGEFIPPVSPFSKSPLSFLRSRILFKLLVVFVVLIIIVVEVMTLAMINISKNSLSRLIYKNYLQMAEGIQDSISDEIGMVGKNMRFLAENENLSSGSPAVAARIFPEVLRQNPYLNSLFLMDLSGNVAASFSRAASPVIDLREMLVVLRGLKEPGSVYFGDFIRRADTRSYMYIAVRGFFDPKKVILAKVDLWFIDQALADFRGSSGASIYLVDGKGKLLARAHPEKNIPGAMPDKEIISLVLKGKSGVGEFLVGQKPEMFLAAYVPGNNFNGGVIIESPVSLAYADIRRMQVSSLLFIIVGAFLVVGVGAFFARSIERPLKEMIFVTRKVASGDYSARIQVGSIDEIGELANVFNAMTADLKETQGRLIMSEKLAALGTMAAGMAHEIKNPLVSLRTFSQLIQQKWEDPEFRQKFSAIVPHEIERINKIAESLLKFGRPIKTEMTRVKINAILEEALGLFETECKKKDVRVTTKYAELPEIIADPSQISQAVINIVLNAIQSMDNGGELVIKTDFGEAVKLKRPQVLGEIEKEGATTHASWGENKRGESIPVVFIEITDTGPGITEESLRHLFDPFFTTKVTGSGMGLPITLRIVEEHKGSIRVRSQAGVGTTFIITLPQNPEKLKYALEQAEPEED